MTERSTGGTEQAETVLKWFGTHHRQHRIQVKEIPGSAHWNVLKDSRDPSTEEWERDWGTEANTKPDFRSLRTGGER